jgi:hypothetical protein
MRLRPLPDPDHLPALVDCYSELKAAGDLRFLSPREPALISPYYWIYWGG